MSEKEEEFPFEEFVEALTESYSLKRSIKHILTAICEKNIYWAYSALSTLIEILKSRDQEPPIKCRSLQCATLLLQTCQYPVLVFFELYMTPILLEIANYRGRKSEQLMSYYFQQVQRTQDTPETKKCSVEFVERSVELLFYGAKIKPFRTVESEELRQESVLAKAVGSLQQKRIEEPEKMKWCGQDGVKESRKMFLDKLRRFSGESDEWTEFLLVNLLEQIQTGKKQLLQLRLLLPYGESFITSAIINFCQEELLEISDTLQHKKKYLGVLNELIRSGDIQAIIMVKNSEFVPTILAHISKFPGHQGLTAGQGIYPEIKASKQVKRDFYSDFLRCLQTWATSTPTDYDSQDFNLKSIYDYLKKEKKFKFPQNMLLHRYQKELTENLERNKERNDRLLEILQNMEGSRQVSLSRTNKEKVSNVLPKTTMLAPPQLSQKLQEIRLAQKQLLSDRQSADRAFKVLVQFKDNWITYLESLDFDGADEEHLENMINQGQKSVEQIQLVQPIHASLQKGKLSYRQYKQRIIEVLEFHNDVSMNASQLSRSLDKSKSFKASRLAQSKGKSKLASSKIGKSLLDKMKAKSKIGDKTRMNMSKAMDRSNMLDRSRNTIMETSMRKNISKKEQTVPLVNKSRKQLQEVSITQQYETEQKPLEHLQTAKHFDEKIISQQQKVDSQITPKKSTVSKGINEKIIKIADKEEQQEEKVVRVADYEEEAEPSKKSSRVQQSRILKRNASRLDRSADSESRVSVGRKSASSRRIKESSISRRSKVEQDRTKKISEASQREKIGSAENILIEEDEREKQKDLPLKTKGNFGLHENEGDISSIHSASSLRPNQRSSIKASQSSRIRPNQKGRNSQDLSQINYSREIVKVRQSRQQVVEFITKDFQVAPLVGDYYEEPTKVNNKAKQPENKNKNKKEDSRSLNESASIPKFKRVFERPSEYMDKNDFKLMKKRQNTQSNHPKVEPTRDERQTARQIVSAREIEAEYPKGKEGQLKSISSAKHLDLHGIEEEKDREIQSLQKKIQQLQKQSVTMKRRLAAKDSELRSIKSGSQAGSERGFAQFTTVSGSNFDKSSLRSSSTNRRTQLTAFERQVQSGFKQYLQRVKGNTFKKSLLKLKCLVHRTDQVQIGCLSQRVDGLLESTLYVTPHRYDMIDFSIAIIHDHRLRVKISPESVKLIPALKQQKIHLMIQVLNIPFCLPECEINYKADSEYCSNYNRLTLPIGFSKFVKITGLNISSKDEKHIDYVRSDNFRLNSKVVKIQKITQSFPSFSIVPAGKGRQHMLLGASCEFGESIFNLILNISQKWCWWEGFLLKGDAKPMNFLLCSFKEVIEGPKK